MKKLLKLALLFTVVALVTNTNPTFHAAEVKQESLYASTAAVSKKISVGDTFVADSISYRVTSTSPALEVEAYEAPMRLTTITIPSTVTYNNVTYAVTSIPNGAFYGNYRTIKIVISEGVKTVGEFAFEGCNAVTKIELPSTLETFTTMGFQSLETITLASGNQHFQLIDGVLFTKDETKLWLYPSGKAATSYTVPNGTVTIGESAFYYNKYLQNITLADSVTTIDDYAFYQLNALTSMTFGNNVSNIGDHNLRLCPELLSITFKNSGSLGNYCVYDCESLESIIINGQLNGYGYFSLYNLPSLQKYEVINSDYFTSRDGVLYGGTQLLRYPSAKETTLYVVPDNTTNIAGLAFNHMQYTTEVALNPDVSLTLLAFHYPHATSPMTIYFRDKDNVSLDTSASGVFVGMAEGSHIYLPTKAALESFNTHTSAVVPNGATTIEVKTIPSTELALNKTSITLKRKEICTLTGTLTPYYSTDKITWASDNESIATISPGGVITAIKTGECTITASTDSGIIKTCEITVLPTEISTLDFHSVGEHVYTGCSIEPTVVIKEDAYSLVKGTDYTIEYKNNTNAGTATVIITGCGNYKGTKTTSFTIQAKSISNASVSGIKAQTYTGSAITPNVTVTDGKTALIKDMDYTVSYSNNTNTGTATVTITGTGNYKGTKTTTFRINEAVVSVPTRITSLRFSINENLGYISKITVGTTINFFRSNLNETNYVSVYKDNQKVADNAVLGTGMNACLMNGNTILRKYSIIVTGDVNGDGKINITDMIAIKANILKKSNLSGPYAKAGDVNGDNKINITDFIKIKATLLKKDTITGVAVK